MNPHVVWDWNGTLFDDFEISVEATSLACKLVGGCAIDGVTYRRCFRRPVRTFYEHLLARELVDAEWQLVAQRYHEHYRDSIGKARLRPEAIDVLAELSQRGVTQSLLSMSDHDELLKRVQHDRLTDHFVVVQGADSQQRTEPKRIALERHIVAVEQRLRRKLPYEYIVVVGDTLDDALAAAAIGARCVLLADGCYEEAQLDRTQFGIAPCLRSAADAGIERVARPAR